MVTTYDSGEDLAAALEAGAATYVLKEALCDDLVRLVRDVHAGKRPSPHLPGGRPATASGGPGPALTPREIDVLKLIAQGLRNKEIARLLGVSEETVKTHVSNILTKLGCASRVEIVRAAATHAH